MMNAEGLRLSRLTLPGKLLATLFLLIVGPGYLAGTANIMFQHEDADGEPGLTLNDLRRTFHGMEKTVTPEAIVTVNSTMLEQVRPDGDMREYLELEGEPSIRGLMTWLEAGAKEENFATAGLAQEGDPSAKDILATCCQECHHADGGEMEDIPFAANAESEIDYAMVLETAEPEFERHEQETQTLVLKPTPEKKLVHITHAHVLSIPVFTMIVGSLFLLTGFGSGIKLLLAPLPMLAVMADIGSWWLARYSEPFIYVIAASGAVFGIAYALQILCILGSMWFGRKEETTPAAD
jgi:hypothetical protein